MHAPSVCYPEHRTVTTLNIIIVIVILIGKAVLEYQAKKKRDQDIRTGRTGQTSSDDDDLMDVDEFEAEEPSIPETSARVPPGTGSEGRRPDGFEPRMSIPPMRLPPPPSAPRAAGGRGGSLPFPFEGAPSMRIPQGRLPRLPLEVEVSRGRVTGAGGRAGRAASPELAARKAARLAEKANRAAERKARMNLRAASGRARQARGVASRATRDKVIDPESRFSPIARGLRATFASHAKFRDAFLVSELLGKPVSQRQPADDR